MEVTLTLPSWLSAITAYFSGFLEFFKVPLFWVAVLFVFAIGQFIHAQLKYRAKNLSDFNKATIIWVSEFVIGYYATLEFLDTAMPRDERKHYAWIAGIMAIGLYFALLRLAYWRKWPWLYTFISFKRSWYDEEADEIKSGQTLQIFARKRKTKR